MDKPERSPTIAEQIDALTEPDFMTSLARGLAVLRAFSDQHRSLTIAQISHRTGIPRAAVRRCLFTLKQLGFASADGNNYTLKPRVLTLGYSYLSSTPLPEFGLPILNRISKQLNESCALAVLDENEVLYVARYATSRTMSAALNTGGNRLPAYCSSLGRVLLAHLAPDALDAYFAQVKLKACTDYTVVSASRIRELLGEVRRDGHALVDEELEIGLRAIAVPVRDASGQVIAALNVGVPTSRVPTRLMIGEFLPVLLQGAQDLTALLPQARHRASQAQDSNAAWRA